MESDNDDDADDDDSAEDMDVDARGPTSSRATPAFSEEGAPQKSTISGSGSTHSKLL